MSKSHKRERIKNIILTIILLMIIFTGIRYNYELHKLHQVRQELSISIEKAEQQLEYSKRVTEKLEELIDK